MKSWIFVFTVTIILLGSILLKSQAFADTVSQKEVSLKGEWEYLPYDAEHLTDDIKETSWATINLPSNWFLLGKKEYPPKLKANWQILGSNAPGVLWPIETNKGLDYSGTVWFRKKVSLDPASNTPVILDLDMVDYYADVYVNNQHLQRHEGYFQPWSVNITPAVKPGINEIIVKVSAPKLVFDMSQQYPISWPKNQNQVKGIFLYHDTRPGGTSWRGQECSTGGIIRDIKIRYSSGIDNELTMVTPSNVTAKSADLNIEFHVQNRTNQPKKIMLKGQISPYNFNDTKQNIAFSLPMDIKPGSNVIKHNLKVKNPKLWWTWDIGYPNLYKLQTTFADADNQAQILDTKENVFGIRSIYKDSKWVWYLNGKRIYVRGSNYIATQWLSQVDKNWYKRDIDLVKGANLNTLRIHAHLERPEFYDTADEEGILVWQDFPLQWGYTDLASFRNEAVNQAKDMVMFYYNHPSIVLWCMHNESPHAMSWMQKRNPNQNLELDNKLAEAVSGIDSSRIIHRDSGTGDGHPYPGWYVDVNAEGKNSLDKEPMITEYGAQALPNLPTLQKMFEPDTLWPDKPEDWEVWKYTNFQPEQTFKLAKIAQGKNIFEFINNSQQYQANIIKYVTERLRQRKWTSNTGVIHFMFVDDWPSITWSVVDYYRNPKAGYYALQESMQPLLASIKYEVDNPKSAIEIILINDYHKPYKNLKIKWSTGNGQVNEKSVSIEADSIKPIASLGYLPSVTEGKEILKVWIEDSNGNVISQNSLSRKNFINTLSGNNYSK